MKKFSYADLDTTISEDGLYNLLCFLLRFHGNILILLWHLGEAVVLHLKAAVPQLPPVDSHHHSRHKITRGEVPTQRDSLDLILQYELVVNADVFDWRRGLGHQLVLSAITEIVNVFKEGKIIVLSSSNNMY